MSYFNNIEQDEQRSTCVLQNFTVQAIDHKKCNTFFYYDSLTFFYILLYKHTDLGILFYFALCNIVVILCLTIDKTGS